ncbi:MAG: YiiX/YebB-like N1pC/P60 family cysteine hydrolase [Bacilli bacterium]
MFLLIKFIKRILLAVLAVFIVFLINGMTEKIFVNDKINDFKKRGELIITADSNPHNHYYLVNPEYDYEDISRSIFDMDLRIIGAKADVIVTNRNPMRHEPMIAWAIGLLSQAFFLGHATINEDDDGRYMYEVIGNSSNPDNNVVAKTYNDWITFEEQLGEEGVSPLIIGLRAKDTTDEERDQMVEFASEQMGKPYNYTFLFNRENSFYCTDLVSRAYSKAGTNINYDFLATTGIDLIVSPKLYIIFIRETIIINDEKHYNFYYLG